MKVAVLQQFLRSLTAPLQAAGASPKVTNDLEQACNALESFKEEDIGQFAAHLVRSEEFHRTQLLPMLKTKERPKGAARTLNETQVQHLAQQVRQMEERAAAAPGGNRMELAPELDRLGLENLTKPEALALAKAVGVPTKTRTTAEEAIQLVRRLVLEGREAAGRPSRPAAPPPPRRRQDRAFDPAGATPGGAGRRGGRLAGRSERRPGPPGSRPVERRGNPGSRQRTGRPVGIAYVGG